MRRPRCPQMDHKHTRGGQDCTERFGEKNSRTVGTPGGNSKSWVLPVSIWMFNSRTRSKRHHDKCTQDGTTARDGLPKGCNEFGLSSVLSSVDRNTLSHDTPN
jgi:hypothetical protein